MELVEGGGNLTKAPYSESKFECDFGSKMSSLVVNNGGESVGNWKSCDAGKWICICAISCSAKKRECLPQL